MRNVSDKTLEELKTHILCPVTFFENEIMWKNIVEWAKPNMTIWRIGIVRRIP